MAPYRNKLRAIIAVMILSFVFVKITVWSVNEDMKFNCTAAEHQVMENETIYKIAETHCTGDFQSAVEFIMQANGITRENLGQLRVGMIIKVPSGS